MLIEFNAIESGFSDGLGGASGDHYYVVFGLQGDSQDGKDVYFEFDDQINGGVNLVSQIVVSHSDVTFTLLNSATIRAIRNMDDAGWSKFLQCITETFEPQIVQASGRYE